MTTAHTPTPSDHDYVTARPWLVDPLHRNHVTTPANRTVLTCNRSRGENVARNNAAHIVRCVNAHDALVAALQKIAAGTMHLEACEAVARAALAAAKGDA